MVDFWTKQRWLPLLGMLSLLGWTTSCAHWGPPPPTKEARAVWISRFEYCEYSTTHDQDSIRQYIANAIDQAAQANFNLVFFQVRGNGDAYYTPGLEPWGNLLTDTLGKDPGWDPLAFALQRAHERGLELHAWVNTFPVWRGLEPPPETTPRSPYLEHPEWIVCDSTRTPQPLSDHYVSFSPGIPEVHDYILSVVKDIVQRYDVDGIHFDYIRYPERAPEKGFSHDSISVARFNSQAGNPYRLGWEDWQREQLNQFVYKAYNELTALKPELKISAAVIGSYNEGGWNAYYSVYQDPRRWVELGKMDFITPMMYWPRRHPDYPFAALAEKWQDQLPPDRYVFPGIGTYRYTSWKRNYNWREALAQIDVVRDYQMPGMVFFGSRSLKDRWESLRQRRFSAPANLPAMTWKDSLPPGPPTNLQVKPQKEGVTLLWIPSPSADVRRYNIYVGKEPQIANQRTWHLAAVTPGPVTSFTLSLTQLSGNRYVAVSALDAAWNESELSGVVSIFR